MSIHIQSPGIAKTVVSTIKDIDAYLATLTVTQLGGKKFPDCGKKGADSVFDEMFIEVP